MLRALVVLFALAAPVAAQAFTQCQKTVLSPPGAVVAEEGSNPVGFGEWRYGGYTARKRVVVVAAANGGQDLQKQVTIRRGAGPTSFLRLAAANTHVYAVWSETNLSTGQTDLMFDASDNHGAAGSWVAPLDLGAVTSISQIAADGHSVHIIYITPSNAVVVTSSTNFGQTFSDPLPLGSGHEAVIASDGRHVYAAWEYTVEPNRYAMFAASHDGGVTFAVKPLTDFGREPILSLNKDTGRLSLVWRIDSPPEGVYLQSTDHGKTWSQMTLDSPARQFMVVDHGQYVWISYLKGIEIGGVTDWEVYLATSSDGGASFPLVQNLGGPSGIDKLQGDDFRPIPHAIGTHFVLAGLKSDGVYVWSGNKTAISGALYLGPGKLASPWGQAILWQGPNGTVTYAACSG